MCSLCVQFVVYYTCFTCKFIYLLRVSSVSDSVCDRWRTLECRQRNFGYVRKRREKFFNSWDTVTFWRRICSIMLILFPGLCFALNKRKQTHWDRCLCTLPRVARKSSLCFTDMSLHFSKGFQNMLLFALQTLLCTSLRAAWMCSSLLYRHFFALCQGLPENLLSALQTCLCTCRRASRICSSWLCRHFFALREGLQKCAFLCFTDISLHFAKSCQKSRLCFTDMSLQFSKGFQNMLLFALQTRLCTLLRAAWMCSCLL